MEEVIGDFDSQFRELDEDDFKQFIKTTEITPAQLEIQDKCLKLRNMLRETIEKFFKAQASEAPTILLATLEDKSKDIQSLLSELYSSSQVSVPALFNTRVCKSLTYVRDFCLSFVQAVEMHQEQQQLQSQADNEFILVISRLKEILQSLSQQMNLILTKWKNKVLKIIFDDNNMDDLSTSMNKKMKQAFKMAMKKAAKSH